MLNRDVLRRSACRLLGPVLLASVVVSLAEPAHAAEQRVSTVTAVSSSSDPVGKGQSYVYRPGAGSIRVNNGGLPNLVVVEADGPEGNFTFRFEAPGGAPLSVGTYDNVPNDNVNTADQAGMRIVGPGSYCHPESTGRFEVRHFKADLSEMLIHYENSCTGKAPLFGEIRINMPVPAGPLVIPSAISWPALDMNAAARTVPVHVVNTDTTAQTVGAVAVSGGLPNEFTVQGACPTLAPGESCATQVGFTPRAVGERSAQLTVELASGARAVGLTGTGLLPAYAGKPTAAPTDPIAIPYFDAVRLSWSNPADLDFTEVVVRGAAGGTPPASITDGVEVYRGSSQYVLLEGLPANTALSYAVFARDVEGLVSVPATIVVPGVKVSLRVERSTVTYGEDVILRGRAVDALTGAGMTPVVSIFAVDQRGNGVMVADTVATDWDGNFDLTTSPGKNYDFYAVYPGDETHLGSTSAPARSWVRALMLLDPVQKKVKLGRDIQLVAGAGPIDRNTAIVIQQLVKGKWKTVAKKKPSAKGVAVIKIKTTKKGKFTYRAHRADAAGASSGTSRQVKVTVI